MSRASNKKGLFITVEGIEGAGKTTNLNFIKDVLVLHGNKVEVTREPGGTPLAEDIRELLLAPRAEHVAPSAELLLMFAARAQHLSQKILPAIDRGDCVLSDRFTDATYAYQGGGRGESWQAIAQLENLVQGGFRPNLTILLCINPEVGLARAKNRGSLDRFEREKLDFYTRVQNAYMKRVEEDPKRFCVVDAGRSLQEIQGEIEAELRKRL